MINDFKIVEQFEQEVAKFFDSPYAVATDCCTHALELCLRYEKTKFYTIPKRTYLSVPFLANKIGIKFDWRNEQWEDYYYLTEKIIDAAVLWKKNSYLPNTLMCLSFQFKKHLSLGRGGMILTDDRQAAKELKKMSYDGREPCIPWRSQNIKTVGYHYYMTPETARLGINKLADAIKRPPKKWRTTDWPDLTKMEIFK